MTQETQAACGFALSTCSAISSFTLAWMPVLQIIAVVIAAISGVFAILVSIKTLRAKKE
jgi:hypothetical protein